MSDPELVDIEAEIRRETDTAYLLSDGYTEAWVLKSQVENNDGTFTMPLWLAKDKNFV